MKQQNRQKINADEDAYRYNGHDHNMNNLSAYLTGRTDNELPCKTK